MQSRNYNHEIIFISILSLRMEAPCCWYVSGAHNAQYLPDCSHTLVRSWRTQEHFCIEATLFHILLQYQHRSPFSLSRQPVGWMCYSSDKIVLPIEWITAWRRVKFRQRRYEEVLSSAVNPPAEQFDRGRSSEVIGLIGDCSSEKCLKYSTFFETYPENPEPR